jgi:hypothetical protein
LESVPHGTTRHESHPLKKAGTCTSWALHSLNAWLLGPSKDHYHCHLYYVPKTCGYRVSGSVDLFPQHCIAPPYSDVSHVQELAEEIQMTLEKITDKQRSMQVIRTLAKHLNTFVNNMPQPIPSILQEPQKVLTNLADIQWVTVGVPTPLANNPMAPLVLKKKQQTHQQKHAAILLVPYPRLYRRNSTRHSLSLLKLNQRFLLYHRVPPTAPQLLNNQTA